MYYVCAAGKISIEQVTSFLSKNVSKGATDMTSSLDNYDNPANPHMQTLSEIRRAASGHDCYMVK